ncbi:MAG: amidohydrolase family protein [Candidatus Nanoarchaeia archaeon]|nr:amidohydrolase family protein [Candidatus Nanoarchaeia archaeon]
MIIDGHAHMITESIAKSMKISPHILKYTNQEWTKHSVKEHVESWLYAMNKNEIEKTIFMATAHLNEEFTQFINSSSRFVGFARINPLLPDALNILKTEYSNGMRGVKLYATNDGFDVSCDCNPIYEYCEKMRLPIVIHFGMTIGGKSDLFHGNPVMLSRVLRDFPDINFTIAHFGAGFFRELLMLKYKQDNLFVDTSGTNNWIDYQDNVFSLKEVFKKTIKVFGPKNIIFGSDTRIFPDGYREHILKEQKGILDELMLSENDKEDIMYNNAKRVFNL